MPQGGAGVAVQPVRAHRAAGAFAHRAAGAVDRAAGCERWMPTGCNKYAPQKTAGLPGTELRKRADRQQWDVKSQQSFAPSE